MAIQPLAPLPEYREKGKRCIATNNGGTYPKSMRAHQVAAEELFLIISGMAKKAMSPPKSFEEALDELERILAEIESGETSLEQSLEKYERGNFLIQHCRSVLNNAEKQIELLTKQPDGTLRATPMEEAE